MAIIARGQITVVIAEQGEQGAVGASLLYRGNFSPTTPYYNSPLRRDVVKQNDTYYIYKGTNGVSADWNIALWENFGADFSSVATDLLLAENANIAGFIFRNNKLTSQTEYDNHPQLSLDGVRGEIEAHRGKIGGFEIAYDGMTSIDDEGDNDNDAYIIVRRKKSVGGYDGVPLITGYRESRIGTNVLPPSVGTAGLGYFENSEPAGHYNTIQNNRYYYSWQEFLAAYPEWGDNVRNITYSNAAWTNIGSYKRSPPIADNGITTCRFNFTTAQDNQYLTFEIKAYSEVNFDFMQIGYLDQIGMTRSYGYYDRVSDNGKSKYVSIYVPSAGSHFIEFCYAKDVSQASNGDYGLFRYVSSVATWSDFKNSDKFSEFPYAYSEYWDDSLGDDELSYINVPYYSYEWVQSPWSINRGVLMDVQGAWQNIALDVFNGSAFFRRGAVVQFSNEYIGRAYTDILETYIGRTNIFIFNSITSSIINVRLPATSHINSFSSGASSVVTFEFTIVVTASTNMIQLSSQAGAQLKNNNGGNMTTQSMAVGDVITLVYCNGCYYIKELRL